MAVKAAQNANGEKIVQNQAEGVFGVIKQTRLYTRIKRRGLENVEIEIFKLYAGYNLMKFHNYRLAQKCKA